jgi:hypothetical protein
LCRRHGPIWPELERHLVSGRHVADMSATFPTKLMSRVRLGWEFQFLVLISGTPIGCRIPILFLIPDILVGIFFRIPLL